MTATILREEYIELTGKRPFNGWNEEKLKVRISDYKREHNISDDVEVSGPPVHIPIEDDVREGHKSRFEALESLKRQKIMKQLLNLQPVMIGEKVFAIIDNNYIPWTEAEIVMLNKLKEEIDLLIEEKTAIINS